MTDNPEKVIDALHAELTDSQRAMGEMLCKSIESGGAEDAPPMPDDLLNDILSDLGVEKGTAANHAQERGMLVRFFELLRGKPLVITGLAAAACVVAIFAVNQADDIKGKSGVRGAGTVIAEPPIVVFVDPTAEQKSAAQENFDSSNLRFTALGGEAVANGRARILIEGGKVRAFQSGETEAFIEVDAPADPFELMDKISALTQEFELEEQ